MGCGHDLHQGRERYEISRATLGSLLSLGAIPGAYNTPEPQRGPSWPIPSESLEALGYGRRQGATPKADLQTARRENEALRMRLDRVETTLQRAQRENTRLRARLADAQRESSVSNSGCVTVRRRTTDSAAVARCEPWRCPTNDAICSDAAARRRRPAVLPVHLVRRRVPHVDVVDRLCGLELPPVPLVPAANEAPRLRRTLSSPSPSSCRLEACASR